MIVTFFFIMNNPNFTIYTPVCQAPMIQKEISYYQPSFHQHSLLLTLKKNSCKSDNQSWQGIFSTVLQEKEKEKSAKNLFGHFHIKIIQLSSINFLFPNLKHLFCRFYHYSSNILFWVLLGNICNKIFFKRIFSQTNFIFVSISY